MTSCMIRARLSVPYFSASAARRSQARRFAAIWARMSPRRSAGVRTFVKMMSSTSRFTTPARWMRTGGSRSPSPYTSVTAP